MPWFSGTNTYPMFKARIQELFYVPSLCHITFLSAQHVINHYILTGFILDSWSLNSSVLFAILLRFCPLPVGSLFLLDDYQYFIIFPSQTTNTYTWSSFSANDFTFYFIAKQKQSRWPSIPPSSTSHSSASGATYMESPGVSHPTLIQSPFLPQEVGSVT